MIVTRVCLVAVVVVVAADIIAAAAVWLFFLYFTYDLGLSLPSGHPPQRHRLSLSASASASAAAIDIDIAVANADANAICVRLLHHSAAVAVAVVAGVRRVCFGLGVVCGIGGVRNEERGTGAGFACEGEMHNLRAQSRAEQHIVYCAN